MLNEPTGASRSLEFSLVRSFEGQPVEDGMNHPSQDLLESALLERNDETKDYLIAQVRDPGCPFRCDLLKIMGRLPLEHFSDQGVTLVAELLKDSNVAIREAAIELAELWEDPRLVPLLEKHEESIPWVADYARKVAGNLGR